MTTPSLSVGDYMMSRYATLQEDQDVMEALRLFTDHNIFGAAVLDHMGNLVGILSVTDCIKAAVSSGYNANWRGTVGSLMSKDVRTVDIRDNIMEVAELFMKEPYRRYPVLDGERVVGVLTRLDVLKALRKISESGRPL